MTITYYKYLATPIGNLLLAGDGEALTELGFPAGRARRRHQHHWTHRPGLFKEATIQLLAYFAGDLEQFDLSLVLRGTEFQLLVWEALQTIPYGHTTSYIELARRVGRPKASRAVGAANGKNPIPIIIPCHRVIGSGGNLVGFGGGLDTKQQLLTLEQGVIQARII